MDANGVLARVYDETTGALRISPDGLSGTYEPLGTAAFPTTAQPNLPRYSAFSLTGTMTDKLLRWGCFTAVRTATYSTVSVQTGATAAGATPTLVRIGVWTADTSGALLSLVGSTPNTTTMLAATSTIYTTALSASVTLTQGSRYALGLLVVTAATAPAMVGHNAGAGSLPYTSVPVLGGSLSAQTDLPSSAAANPSGVIPYIELRP
jgi:hypothetical protein